MAERPNLDTIRRDCQVAEDRFIDYHPRLLGQVDIPFTEAIRITRTEGDLLDRLSQERGLLGMKQLQDQVRLAFGESAARFPDRPPPPGIPEDRISEWQGNETTAIATRSAIHTGTQ